MGSQQEVLMLIILILFPTFFVKIRNRIIYKNFMTATFPNPPFSQVTVQELQERLSSGDCAIQLVDVREPQEVEIASIAGFINLPLSEFAVWGEHIHSHLDCERETLVLCHHGVRSAQMCQWLVSQGFTNVKNISGGIDAYSIRVDSSVPQY